MLWPLDEEWDTDIRSGDPLSFPGYGEQLADLPRESVRTGLVRTDAGSFVLIEGDFDVIGGSMGLVHGEKVVRALDRATDAGLPVVVVTRSGGARMQEGMLSLIQMGRTAAVATRHADAGLLSISVHRSPTTGGVFASYGSLTDLRIVEPDAVIGFAGPRVVEQTGGEPVAGRSHDSETALRAGLVDAVVPTDELTAWVEAALGFVDRPPPAAPDRTRIADGGRKGDDDVPDADADAADGADHGGGAALHGESEVDPAWAAVLAARRPDRPSGLDVATALVDSWSELEGGTDPVVRCAVARVGTHRVVVAAMDRHAGRGQPGTRGFRTVQRAVELAGRLGLPIVSLVDTPGADPRSPAENDGIAAEIARTFAAYARVPVPTVSVCVGEGGSGGALAMAVADRFLVQRSAIFSVIGPEGAAAILERDADRAPQVAPRLRLTSGDLLDLGIVDAITGDDVDETVRAIRTCLDELTTDGVVAPGRRIERWDEATARWLR